MIVTTKIAKQVFEMYCTLKLYHWKTSIYSRHIASDKVVADINTIGDKMIEIMITRYGRPESLSINKISVFSDDEIVNYLKNDALRFWGKDFDKLISKKDLDLYNLRDELVGAIHQTLYLMTLS